MKITNGPAPPAERLAQLLLFQATENDASELRLSCGSENMEIRLDDEEQPAPGADVYRPTAEAILKFAGVRVWPWTKRIVGKRLDVEIDSSGQCSSWVLGSSNIETELVLTRVRDDSDDTQLDG